MRGSRGVVTFYDERGWPLAHTKYGLSNRIKWMVDYKIAWLKRKGKIVSYIQIEPYANENMVRENGKNKYV